MDEHAPLAGKHILCGVTGGIAAYKTLDVIGRLRERGAEFRVVMTDSATRLVQPLTFQARSGYPVVTDLWAPAQTYSIEHISHARWADLLLVAPLTANTMAKFARGLADDALSTLHLAYRGPMLVAPAMNTMMYEHPSTQANLETLRARGVEVIEPESGALACGEVGVGKMASVERIVEATTRCLTRTDDLAGCRVLVTAGPTREFIDPARYLTNPSSGRMGYALADEAARRGAEVALISGPTALPTPVGVTRRDVVSAAEMLEATMAECDAADALIFCAAVADFAPAESSPRKTKKTGGDLTLRLRATADIARETAARARPGQLRVGFAAETDDLEANARAKIESKRLDFIVANDIGDPDIGFASADNRVVLIEAGGGATPFERMDKRLLAARLFDRFVPALHAKRTAAPEAP